MRRPVFFSFIKELIGVFSITFILIGFVGALLFANYQSQEKLKQGALKQYEYELQSRGMDLAYFLDTQSRLLKSSATNWGKLQLYFESQAMGMSMEYGLKSILLGLQLELDEFYNSILFRGRLIFDGIAFYNARGKLMVKSEVAASALPDEPLWHKNLFQQPEGFYIYQAADRNQDLGRTMLYFTKYYTVKGHSIQAVAVFSRRLLQEHFLKPGRGARFTGIFVPKNQWIGDDQKFEGDQLPLKDQTFFPEMLFQKWHSFFNHSEPVLGFSCPVGDTKLTLKEVASKKVIIGNQSPLLQGLTMVFIFILLLGAAGVIMFALTQNLVLQARVEESGKREKDIALKNELLEAEIENRKRQEAARISLEAQIQRVRKMEAIGLLAGRVAHDLNNILTGIVSYPDLLLMQLPEDSELREPVETIKESGRKASAVVQDLLTLARRGVMVNEVICLNAIIRDYLQSPEHLKMISCHEGVTVTSRLGGNLPNILGSPLHLSKTVMNLVTNAAEAIPEGGRISITTKSVYVDRPVGSYEKVNEGDYICLSISDTGVGMVKEDREKIFEPFFTKKVMGRSGTGLGMSVVWGTVKDHNGYIDLSSAVGKGTTFDLYFPVTDQELMPEKKAESIDRFRGQGQALLIVDDEKEQRDITVNIFLKLGYKPVAVESGEKAVAYMETHSVDLVVLDMIMEPGIDGLETYERIIARHPAQKAVIVSGFSQTARIRRAEELGVRKVVAKPYSLIDIASAVKEALNSPADDFQSVQS